MKWTGFSFLGRLVENKLLFKLVLVYSTIMLVPLLLTIYTITDHVNAKMVELELNKQEDVLNKMSAYIEEQHNKVRDIVFWLHPSGKDGPSAAEMLTESNTNDSAFLPYVIKNRITSELNEIAVWDKDILDIVLIGTDNDVFSTTKRSVSVGYDFSRYEPVSRLEPADKTMYKMPFEHVPYILGGDAPVISYTGNLFDLSKAPYDQSVGKYIINLSSREMMNHYRQIAGNSEAALYVYGEDGTILFSNEPEAIGTVYPFRKIVSSLRTHEAKLDGRAHILNQTELAQAGLHIVVQTPTETITQETNLLIRNILAIFFGGVLIVLVLTSLFSSNIAIKIKRLLEAMRQLEKGQFDTRVSYDTRDELGQLAAAFNRMCERLKEHVNMVYFAEVKTKNAELASLQARINPHFLLNTIESIRMKAVEQQTTEISDMLYMLGRLFHWKVRSTELIITVEEELDYISSYLYLMQFRYQEQMHVNIKVDEELHELGIPKLLLQPIIENASQHGLFHNDRQARLSVIGYRDRHQVVFDIADNGVGIDPSRLEEIEAAMEEAGSQAQAAAHIGLGNVHQRIRILFGEPYGVSVTSRKDHWTRVSVTIPAMYKKEMEALVPDFYR